MDIEFFFVHLNLCLTFLGVRMGKYIGTRLFFLFLLQLLELFVYCRDMCKDEYRCVVYMSNVAICLRTHASVGFCMRQCGGWGVGNRVVTGMGGDCGWEWRVEYWTVTFA